MIGPANENDLKKMMDVLQRSAHYIKKNFRIKTFVDENIQSTEIIHKLVKQPIDINRATVMVVFSLN